MSEDSLFPMNVVAELKRSMKQFLDEHEVTERPLRRSDPVRSIGVFPFDGEARLGSQQIGQIEPSLWRYNFRIQNMVKAAEEIEGTKLFTLDCNIIKVVLYRDNDLAVRLAQLTEEILGRRETAKRWGISRQRYMNNQISNQFLYLAQTDFWLETEIIELV